MKWYYWLGSILFVLLGFWTLIPAEAGKPCLLGYYAHCSFTPISTMNAPITEKAYFVEDSYTVTFTQSGLPSGTSWSVTFGGTKKSSTSSTITFKVKSGNYSWSVSTPVSGGTGIRYVASPESGSMKVPSNTSQSITYTKQYKLTISATSGGSTNPAEGSYWYDSDSNVTVSASPSRQFKAYLEAHGKGSRIWATFSPSSGTPKFTSTLELKVQSDASPGDYTIQVLAYGEGYKFDRWILDNSSAGSNSSITITMNDPHTLKAVFYQPYLKVSLSKSSISIIQGETGDLMVTVTETSTDHQNHPTFTLTVEEKYKVTIIVKDYRGKPLSGVTVTLGGQSKNTDSSGQAVFTVNPGTYTITVPSNIGAGVYTRDFYKWSDGKTGNSRTETISRDVTFTAKYNALAFFGEFSASEIWPPPDPFASIYLKATGKVYYGDPQPLANVKVKVVFHLVSWGNLLGRKTVSATATTDSNGEFTAIYSSVFGGTAYSLEYVEAYVISPGYQSETVTYGTKKTFYTVTFTQSGLPAGTEWKVNLDGHEKSSTSNYIEFYMPNGAYSYTVESPIYEGSSARYVASPSYGTVRVNGLAKSVSIKFNKEYKLTMEVSGLGSTDPAEGSHWIAAGSKVTIKAYPAGDHRFSKWTGSGSGSYTGTANPVTITMNGPIITEKATFAKQALVLFDSDIGSDASGTVLVVDGKSYSPSSLPKTFRWNVGSRHSFSWTDTVNAESGKRYVWKSASGLSTKRSGTITVPDNGGSVTAYYKTQYRLTVEVSACAEASTLGSPVYYGWVWDPWPRIHYFVHGRIVAESNVSADVEAIFDIAAPFVSFTRNATAECKENGEFYIDIYAFDFYPRLKKITLKVTKEGGETEKFTLTLSPSQPGLVYEPVIFIAAVAAFIVISSKRKHRKAEKQKKNSIFPG